MFFQAAGQGACSARPTFATRAGGYTNWLSALRLDGNRPTSICSGMMGSRLINSQQGIAATTGICGPRSLHHSPDAISWGWPGTVRQLRQGAARR